MERYLTQRRFRILQAGLIWLFAVLGFFALWELVEAIFFPVIPKYVMERLYLFRGIVSAFGSGILAIWLFLKEDRRYRKEKIKRERIAVLGRFSSHMAHEIRNPLTALSLNTELLLQEMPQVGGPKAEDCQGFLNTIAKQTERLSALTERYLNLTMNSAPMNENFDPAVILRELAEIFKTGYEPNGVHCVLEIPEGFHAVLEGNAVFFREALRNILQNAVDAMPHGGVLRIGIAQRRHSLEVTITDTGVGMTRETQERLFEPFFTTKVKGVGLGLCLSHQQLDAFDAVIRFQSSVGKGTTFHIQFPLLKLKTKEVSV